MDGRTEYLPILQDFVPYRGRCPATAHFHPKNCIKRGKGTADYMMPFFCLPLALALAGWPLPWLADPCSGWLALALAGWSLTWLADNCLGWRARESGCLAGPDNSREGGRADK